MTAEPHVSYDTAGPLVTREELEAFAGGLLQAVGMDLEGAGYTARTLVHATCAACIRMACECCPSMCGRLRAAP